MTAAFPDRRRRAFITGITGQDGSYLAELLIGKGYEVHGIKRRSSSFNTDRVDHLVSDWHEHETRFFLHFADLSDATSLSKLLYRIAPDEIYHLGAQSHVRVSFDIPEYTGDITPSAPLACSTQSAKPVPPPGLTTPPAAKCSAKPTNARKPKPRPSVRAARTAAQNPIVIG